MRGKCERQDWAWVPPRCHLDPELVTKQPPSFGFPSGNKKGRAAGNEPIPNPSHGPIPAPSPACPPLWNQSRVWPHGSLAGSLLAGTRGSGERSGETHLSLHQQRLRQTGILPDTFVCVCGRVLIGKGSLRHEQGLSQCCGGPGLGSAPRGLTRGPMLPGLLCARPLSDSSQRHSWDCPHPTEAGRALREAQNVPRLPRQVGGSAGARASVQAPRAPWPGGGAVRVGSGHLLQDRGLRGPGRLGRLLLGCGWEI